MNVQNILCSVKAELSFSLRMIQLKCVTIIIVVEKWKNNLMPPNK